MLLGRRGSRGRIGAGHSRERAHWGFASGLGAGHSRERTHWRLCDWVRSENVPRPYPRLYFLMSPTTTPRTSTSAAGTTMSSISGFEGLSLTVAPS